MLHITREHAQSKHIGDIPEESIKLLYSNEIYFFYQRLRFLPWSTYQNYINQQFQRNKSIKALFWKIVFNFNCF